MQLEEGMLTLKSFMIAFPKLGDLQSVGVGGRGTGNALPRAGSAGGGLIWILGTPISSVGHSISSTTFDIEDFDIECSFDMDVFYVQYRISISRVFDIEGHMSPSISKVTKKPVDIEVSSLRYP